MSSLVAVTVVGVDRPGIVASICKVLYDKGCNLEDVSSTILRGHFSMMLLVHVAPAIQAEGLERDLQTTGEELGLTVTVRRVEETTSKIPVPTHMVSVYGSDKPGIVFRVAETLAKLGANITDLTSRMIGEDDAPVYAVMLEVSFPDESDPVSVLSLRDELGLEVSVHPLEAGLL